MLEYRGMSSSRPYRKPWLVLEFLYCLSTQGNYIVFNIHESMIRNKATEAELKELEQIQGNLIWAIDMGYIKSFDELIDMMRKMYKKKWLK